MPEECKGEYVVWIHNIFGDCVESPRQMVAFGFGLMVTCIWVLAQAPTLILNCRNHSAEAIALRFYLLVVVGNITNLVGVFLTETMVTQKFVSIWCLFADIVVISQFVYYHWVKPWWTGEPPIDPGAETVEDGLLQGDREDTTVSALPVMPLLIASAVTLSPDNPYSSKNVTGSVLGWIGNSTFFFGRFPQIVKNCRRGRTTGLSVVYWCCSLFGNTCYGISIVLKDPTWWYMFKQMPWLFGSVGCIPLDITILSQFAYYRWKRNQKQKMIEEEE